MMNTTVILEVKLIPLVLLIPFFGKMQIDFILGCHSQCVRRNF